MSNATRELRKMKAAFPNAKHATKEEILAFGVRFLRDYSLKLADELEKFKLAVELQGTLKGNSNTPVNQRLGIELRQGLIDTLERFAEEVFVMGCMQATEKADNGNQD